MTGTQVTTTQLQGVSETLLIPLAARIVESQLPNGAFRDDYAIEIADKIRFDLRRISRDRLNMVGVVARTVILDDAVRQHIARYPSCFIANLGAGLCTRFHRLDNGLIRWVDVDLPDVVALKSSLVETHDRYHLVARSVLDFTWMDELKGNGGKPLLVIAEGLLMYLSPTDVRSLLVELADRFPGSVMLLEAWASFVTGVWGRLSPTIRRTGAKLGWGLDRAEQLQEWDPRIQVIQQWRPGDWMTHRWGWLSHVGWLRRRLMTVIQIRLGTPPNDFDALSSSR